MNVVKNRVAALAAIVLFLCIATVAADETFEPDSVFAKAWDGISFSFYGSLGGGAGFSESGAYPHALDISAGIAFLPWLSIGGFTEYSILSDFEHAHMGLSLANQKNAGAVASGTEVIFRPWPKAIIHPWIRVRVGGQTLGYLVDSDGKEGFETAVSSRGFYAAAATGPELTLTRHTRVLAWGGWHYSANSELAGIPKNAMSGFDAGLGVSFTFASTVR